MSKEKKKTMVPKLRFPEFRETGEWEHQKLGDLTYKTDKKNKGGEKLPVYSINNKEGFLPQADQFEGVDSNSRGYDTTLYKVIERNTFAYNPARIDVGSIGYSGDLHNIIISSLYVCFKTKESVDDAFLFHFLKTNYFNESVRNSVEGGIRNYLFYENFATINLYLPSKPEQQKNAACLTSLDDLITAQNEKIKVLQSHKKGLMQQLFPAEGERVPRVRFGEFRDAGEWEEKRIEDLTIRGSGHTPNKSKPSYYNGGIKWVSLADSNKLDNGYIYETQTEISTEGLKNSSAVLHPPETVIVSRDAGVGKSAVMYSEMAVSQHFIVWRCDKSKISNWFLYYFLQIIKPKLESIATGSTIKTIGLPYFKELCIPIPSIHEQQKIAACLSSLDNLITTQSQKLEALKAQKKGLMQQLFPNPNE